MNTPIDRRNAVRQYVMTNCGVTPFMWDHVATRRDPDDKTVTLYQGEVQSGKTKCMIGTAIAMYSLHREFSVIVVRNLEQDSKQLMSSASEVFRKCARRIGTIPELFACDLSTTKKNKTKLEDVIQRGRGLVVCMANGSQIDKVLAKVAEAGAGAKRYNLFVDEADAIFDATTAKVFMRSFNRLKEAASRVICVTATSTNLFFKDHQIFTHTIFQLPRPKNYMSVEKLELVELPHRHRPVFSTSTSDRQNNKTYFQCDRFAVDFYHQFTNFNHDSYNQPIIMLHKASRLTVHHEQLMKLFASDPVLRTHWAVVILNGDGVSLFHHSLVNKRVRIAGCVGTEDTTQPGNHIFGNMTIPEILTFIKRDMNEDEDVVQKILIISGQLASRGLNFVSSDFEWHLTHMYYLSAATADDTERIQSMRVCGVFENDFVPVVYMYNKDLEKIKNAKRTMDKVIYEAIMHDDDRENLSTFAKKVQIPDDWRNDNTRYRKKTNFNYVKMDTQKDDLIRDPNFVPGE